MTRLLQWLKVKLFRQQVSNAAENDSPADGYDRVKKSLGPDAAAWLSESTAGRDTRKPESLADELAPTVPDLEILDEDAKVEDKSGAFNPYDTAFRRKK